MWKRDWRPFRPYCCHAFPRVPLMEREHASNEAPGDRRLATARGTRPTDSARTGELEPLLSPTATANVADHRDPRLRRWACFRHREGSRNETGNVHLAPTQPATRIRSWLRDTTELRQQRVTALRSEQPREGRLFFGVRLAKVLERSDREHAVDEVLGTALCSHPTCIGVPGSLVEHFVCEDWWAAAGDSGIGFGAHPRGVGFGKGLRNPRWSDWHRSARCQFSADELPGGECGLELDLQSRAGG